MATQVTWRRGNLVQHEAFTGANAEISVLTDAIGKAINLRLHDGVTPGGIEIGLSSGDFITLEQMDGSAGTGGDDTSAWSAACAESVATGKGILLGPKTYRILSQREDELKWTFKSFLRGVTGSKIIALNTESKQPEGNYKMLLPLNVDRVEISGFEIDGNISADPVDWSANYNNFSGSRGIVLWSSTNVIFKNIVTNNTIQAGIACYVGSHILVEQCRTNRTRGNFGDGFYFMGAQNVLFNNCYAYDFTRIGYVLETNTAQTVSTRDVLYSNCYAEYGHDSSNLYGGIESNFGFWFENYVNATCVNCHSKNMPRQTGGGFKSVPSFWPNHTPSVDTRLYAGTAYINCVAEECRYGFSVDNIQADIRNMTVIDNCSAIEVQIGMYLGSRFAVNSYLQENQTLVRNFYVYIDDNAEAARGIMQLGGFIDVDGLFVKYSAGFNQASWDNESNGYSAVGAFGTDTGFKCVLRNAKVFLDDDTEIPLNVKYRSNQTLDNQELEIHNCWVKQVQVLCKTIKYFGCTIETLGQESAKDFLEYNSCIIKGARPDYLGGSRPVTARASHIKPILFKDCLFDFDTAAPIYLYVFDRVSKEPCVTLDNCVVRKNFEVDNYAFRLNAETTLKNDNNDIFNFEFNNCKFVNTGGATTNPIIFTDGIDVDHFTALGSGNFKSDTLSVNGNATLVPYFNPVTFGKAKPDQIAVAASRDIISNDFNRELVNSTASAYVATLTATANTTAPTGTEITLTKLGTGDISFTPTAPTTVNGTTTFAVTTQYSSRTIRKVAADAWVTV